MSDNFGILTRGRSRSKTPGLLFSENGDSKGAKKIPIISLIEEEEGVVEVPATQSQRPKRQRRSNKAVTSDTSGDIESPKNSQVIVTESVTTTTTITTNINSSQGKEKSATNGSEEKKEEDSTLIVNNAVASEVPESQSIFNNIFNAIKTSTPILSSKRSKKVTEVLSSSSSGTTIDLKAHPAYKEYKEAGEYWNKYPKTDYTYSELSPHRRHLGSGIVNMPNLSRRSLEKYQQRVENLIQGNPQEESFLRRKFLTNSSFQKRSADLQYDSSADEVDVSDLHQKLIFRQQSQSNFLYRFYLLIITAFSSAYSNVRQGVRKIFYYRPNQSASSSSSRYSYTPVKHYGKSGTQRFFNAIQKFVLLCASKVYLFISTILCVDTWILYSRSAHVVENKKRKKFLLALIILLPLLLFGALYLSDEENYINQNNSIARIISKAQGYYHETYASLPSIDVNLKPIRNYFPDVSLPQISMPQWNFNIGWLFTPLISLAITIREFIFGTPQARENLRMSLDEGKFQMLLQHIDAYIDNTIGEKLFNDQEGGKIKEINDRLLLIIANNVNEALIKHEYKLTSKEIDAVVANVRNFLNEDLDERDKLILGRMSLGNKEAVKKIITLANVQQQDIKFENQKVDIDEIVAMILKSDELFILIDGRIKYIVDRLDLHDTEIANIKLHIENLKKEIHQSFKGNDDKMNNNRLNQKNFEDELYKFKLDNDATLQRFMADINGKFSSLSGSQYSSIDASVRRNILNILGFNAASNNDNADASMSEGDIKNWISSTFVAKKYLEERLNNLEMNSNRIFQLQLDQNAGILMEEVNREIEKQIVFSLAAKKSDETLNIIGSSDTLTEADVLSIVKGVLAIYDADKTGLVDYALESAGGEIISTRCTENYRVRHAEISILGIPIWYPSNSPRTVISPSITPGECWAFTGFPGFLVIKLNNIVHITGFSVEHIPQSLASNNNIGSAPNNFTIWGLTNEFDKDPVLYGTYFYSAEKESPSLQYFPVQNKEINQPYQFIELRVESNHGHPQYTCLYRFRVHGDNVKL